MKIKVNKENVLGFREHTLYLGMKLEATKITLEEALSLEEKIVEGKPLQPNECYNGFVAIKRNSFKPTPAYINGYLVKCNPQNSPDKNWTGSDALFNNEQWVCLKDNGVGVFTQIYPLNSINYAKYARIMGYEKTAEEIDKDLKKAILQSIETNDFVEISERAYRVLRRRLSFSISPRRTAFEEFFIKKD